MKGLDIHMKIECKHPEQMWEEIMIIFFQVDEQCLILIYRRQFS